MASTAESGRHTRRGVNRRTLVGLGVLGLGGGFIAGIAIDPATTNHGGGIIYEECTNSTTTMTLREDEEFQLGVGDLSTSGLRGKEDVINFEMVDGSLSATDPHDDADEYIGTDQRIIAAGHDMTFKENGVKVVVALDDNNGIAITRTC